MIWPQQHSQHRRQCEDHSKMTTAAEGLDSRGDIACTAADVVMYTESDDARKSTADAPPMGSEADNVVMGIAE